MTLLTACGDPIVATKMMFADLKILMGPTSPYRNLRVLPHLDHAFPWLDMDVLTDFADDFASVMCDASEKPFSENTEITACYVESVQGRVLVEGAVDEIFEDGGGEKNQPTTPDQAQKFLDATGVDIIVPNVGTEHRATAGQVNYLSDQARMIRDAVGPIMCLHGTSSVKPQDLPLIPEDGFVKVNVYTTLAVHGGQAVARNVLANLANIFTAEQLQELVAQGILCPTVLDENYADTQPPIKPKLDRTTNPPPPRRPVQWFNAVQNRRADFLKIFNYERF